MSSIESTIDPYATTGSSPPKRSQTQPLCDSPGCDVRATVHPANGQWCSSHYRETLSDRERNRASRNRPQTGQTGAEPEFASPVVPTFARTPTPKPTKRVLELVAEGAGLVEVSLLGDRKSYKSYVGSIPNPYTNTQTPTSYAPSLRDWFQDRDDQRVLDEITFAAFTRPWPGETGPTDARVLAGLLQAGRLTVATPFDQFGHEVGLANRTVHQSLERLAAEGWGGFEVGDPDRYGPDHQIEERGKPSIFTLNPRTSPTGSYSPMELPWLISDLFTRDELGSAGWFLLARLLVEHRDEFDPTPVVGVADIMRLTGMTKWRAQRLLPKLTKVGRVEDRKATIYWLRETTETNRSHSIFDNQAHRDRQDKRNVRSLRRNEARKDQPSRGPELEEIIHKARQEPTEMTEPVKTQPEFKVGAEAEDTSGWDPNYDPSVNRLVDRIKGRSVPAPTEVVQESPGPPEPKLDQPRSDIWRKDPITGEWIAPVGYKATFQRVLAGV